MATPTIDPVGTVVELFAGVGGFREGLKPYWETIFSNQFEPSTNIQHASLVYQRHYGAEGHLNEDITKVVARHLETGKVVPNADLIVGGFPCQDYSVAKSLNSSKGLEGKKGVLWWEIYRLVKKNKPKYVFLENVDRLLKSPSNQRGRDFAIMLRTLGDLGYLVEWRLVNAAEQGFPQRRIRVFIVAKRLKDVSKPPNHQDAEEFITVGGLLARTFPGALESAVQSFELDKDPAEISANFPSRDKSPFLNAGYFLRGKVHTAKVKAFGSVPRQTLGSIVTAADDVPAEYWIPNDQIPAWKSLKDGKSVPRTHKASGTTFMYTEGSMAFPDSLDKPARTIVTGEGGTSPSRFKHVILQNNRHRRLTPVELEKLNGFEPDWTRFDANGQEVSSTRRAFFMGNALVIGLVRMVGETLAADHRQ
jgi:DNA (cytosine-5)-methyltransferase 1